MKVTKMEKRDRKAAGYPYDDTEIGNKKEWTTHTLNNKYEFQNLPEKDARIKEGLLCALISVEF